ncbi:hypothetical protein, partial [Vibrio vulnificus]|uniref:hypothetical protein n=1 Tax=Vibrio vulnificus TaxID=672 RepID=UPI0039B3CE0B
MREIQSKAERRLEKTRTCLDLPYKGWADLCLEDIRDAIDAAQEKLNWLKQSRASQATAEKLVARLKAIQSVKG